jgi:hypothetical protein
VAGSQIETLNYGLNRTCSGFESPPALPWLALGAAFVAKIGAGFKAFSQRAVGALLISVPAHKELKYQSSELIEY